MIVTDVLNYFSGGYLFQEKGYTDGETIIKELSQHSPCKALIEEAQNVIQELGLAALEIRLDPTKAGYNAEQDSNVIRIKPNLSANDQRFSLIFELNNLIQLKSNMETLKSAIKGVYKNAEEYTRAVEFFEYNSLKRANVVSRAINNKNGRFFRSHVNNPHEWMPIESMGFNLYYSFYLSDEHKEYHRRGWRNLNNIENPATSIFHNTLKIVLGVSVIAIACLKYNLCASWKK